MEEQKSKTEFKIVNILEIRSDKEKEYELQRYYEQGWKITGSFGKFNEFIIFQRKFNL